MYDVIILGLGAMGSAAAYELAKAGASTLGLEQYGPFHDKGSSFGRTRMIRKVYMEGDIYLPLLERAYEKWQALNALERRPVINLCGGIYIGHREDAVITATRKMARDNGLALEELSPQEIKARFPAFRPDEDMVGLFDPLAGYTNPAGIFSFYHRMAKEHGAALHFNEQVRGVRTEQGKIRVFTDKRDYEAKKLIVSAGAWLGRIAAALEVELPLQVRRMVLNWFDPKGLPSRFKPGPFVPNLWILRDGSIFYGFPWTEEEEGVKYAFHNRFQAVENPDKAKRSVGKREPHDLWRLLGTYVPEAANTLLKSKVCFYTMSPDERFLIGALPGRENILIAGGFSGHGFKFTPVVGEVLRDLALGNQTGYDLSAFDPGRFKL